MTVFNNMEMVFDLQRRILLMASTKKGMITRVSIRIITKGLKDLNLGF